ncbi:unnamed protein product, partial [Amoebophrya sp. A25]
AEDLRSFSRLRYPHLLLSDDKPGLSNLDILLRAELGVYREDADIEDEKDGVVVEDNKYNSDALVEQKAKVFATEADFRQEQQARELSSLEKGLQVRQKEMRRLQRMLSNRDTTTVGMWVEPWRLARALTVPSRELSLMWRWGLDLGRLEDS